MTVIQGFYTNHYEGCLGFRRVDRVALTYEALLVTRLRLAGSKYL